MDTGLDIDRIRAETPGCTTAVHLNNAGAALPPAIVHDTVVSHLEWERDIGGYEAADAVEDAFAGFYDVIARLVGARPDEIAYVENATRAWELAFHSIPFREGDRILTTTSEYASNALGFLRAAEQHGVRVEVVPDDLHGQLCLDSLARMLEAGNVRLVAINHVPTHDGLVNPAAEVGKLARPAGALYLLDACQSVGQLPVNVEEIGCDLLAATGRKFLRGPRGTGFLYARREVIGGLVPPFVDLRAADWTGPSSYELRPDARRFETWERFAAGQLGLAAAASYALDLGLDAIEERVTALAAQLREGLAELPEVRVHDRGLRKSAIVTFTHTALDSPETVGRLAEAGVRARVTEQTYRYDEGPRPRLRVRMSPHYYNTEEEIDQALAAVADLR